MSQSPNISEQAPRATADGQVTAGGKRTAIRFGVAERADDPAIRALLRATPMAGAISLTLEREPSFFADHDFPGEVKTTIVAKQDGRIVCCGSCAVRLRHVNGEPRRVGYLGGLRLEAAAAGRFDVLRRGFGFFREVEASDPAEIYFTSIASDNRRARSVLERRLPGMPAYEFIGELVTLVLRTRKSYGRGVAVPKADFDALAEAQNRHGKAYQFSGNWTGGQLGALSRLGLDWETLRTAAGGSGALWDQRCYKQTVVSGYRPWLRRLRPLINLGACLAGRPRLPRPGSSLALACAFPLHFADGPDASGPIPILRALLDAAARRRVHFLTVAFASADPGLALIRRHFGAREYRTRLYVVSWPGLGQPAAALDGRLPGPEVALL